MKKLIGRGRYAFKSGIFLLALLLLGGALASLFVRKYIPFLSLEVIFVLLALLLLVATMVVSIWQDRRFTEKLSVLASGEYTGENDKQAGKLFWTMNDEEIIRVIAESIHEGIVSRALKTESELHALQNQINPHFLYNTLETIRSRALAQKCNDVAEMVEAMGMMFRYCINSPGELATLTQELDNIHDYLLIQRYRYGDRFSFIEEICDESAAVMNYQLPVMTLQPIIENALVHGINPRVGGGIISLKVEVTQSLLRITVEDDGVGIDDDTLARVRRSLREGKSPDKENEESKTVSIAMKNVNHRIQFYFGKEYGLDIVSTLGAGTAAIITLPRMEMA